MVRRACFFLLEAEGVSRRGFAIAGNKYRSASGALSQLKNFLSPARLGVIGVEPAEEESPEGRGRAQAGEGGVRSF